MMFEKKKLNFWRLAFIFGGVTGIVLFLLWSSPNVEKAQMMDSTMGNMMKSMHLSNATIYSLFTESESKEQMKEMSSHHQSQPEIIYKMNFLTTGLIFLLLPFIIGGSIILAIVWVR